MRVPDFVAGQRPVNCMCRPSKISQCFHPRLRSDEPPCHSANQITDFKVDSAVATRNSPLIGCLRKSSPLERYGTGGSHTRLDH